VRAGTVWHGGERVLVKLLRLTLLGLVAFPAAAHAGDVALVARDVPLGPRALQIATPPIRFNMVGVHWRGPGTVLYRTHRLTGGWTPWVAADADTGPDASSSERAGTRGWNDGTPDWTGASDRIRFRTRGTVTRLRAYYLWSRVKVAPLRGVAAATQPLIASRFNWAANEKIVRAKPLFAPALRLAIVHHTVNTNAYTRAQAPAIVRGIETYHVQGNGWNDIGYNFLIDRYGQIYEGRGGGIDKNVIGAHSEGFNTGSVGVALIGTYSSIGPTAAQRQALVDLLAWRLDVAHVDPLSIVATTSLGNSRFRRGAPLRLRAISGHRDTYFTSCPGTNLYGQLPSIAAAVAQTGLPKIYEPAVAGAPSEGVRFTARLSSPAAWTVRITDAKGAVVATGTGTGTKVSWPWVAPKAGTYGWSIQAGDARPATGVFGRGTVAPTPAAPTLTGLAAAPTVLTPDPSGFGATAHVTFALGQPAQVTARVLDGLGKVVQTLAQLQPLEAGDQALDWFVGTAPDGRYKLALTAKPTAGAAVKATLDLVVDRTLTGLISSSGAISPNGDGVLDTATLGFSLNASVPLRLELRRTGVVVSTLFNGQRGPGPQVVDWNGKDAAGVPLPDGDYEVAATVTDLLGNVTVSIPVVVDSTAPTLTLLDPLKLRFTLSEPATLNLLVNGVPEIKVEPAGTFNVPPPRAGVQTVSAQARDAAGNVSLTVGG
jgi:flagellar hook assembly protein FlgD